MRMDADDITNFPTFAEYVRVKIPELTTNQVIVYNLKKHGHMRDDEVRHALLWGNDPLIVITDLSNNQCGAGQAFGCFDPTNPGQIEIDAQSVADFEDDPYGKGLGQNANSQGVFIAGVTLLHELCHWGNFQHGVDEGDGEEGDAFEKDAYGRGVP
jgi:hypothetical protein